MTSEYLKNTISIAVGRKSSNSYKYIIDENNNGDFADDILYPLYSDIWMDQIIANVNYVDIERYNGNSAYEKKLAFYLYGDKPNNISFQVPEYSYGEFEIQNAYYFICCETYNSLEKIFILPRTPNFSPISKKGIKPSQFIKLGDNYYKYNSHTPDFSKIVLVKQAKLSELKNKKEKSNSTKIVSAQLGLYAPPLEGKNVIDNKKISLSEFKGKYVFVDFWSTTCAPCIREFPNINKVIQTFDKSEFVAIGMVDIRSKINIVDFLKSKEVKWMTIAMNSPTTKMKDYTIISYPTSFLISPEGKIIDKNLRGDELYQKLDKLKIKKYVP